MCPLVATPSLWADVHNPKPSILMDLCHFPQFWTLLQDQLRATLTLSQPLFSKADPLPLFYFVFVFCVFPMIFLSDLYLVLWSAFADTCLLQVSGSIVKLKGFGNFMLRVLGHDLLKAFSGSSLLLPYCCCCIFAIFLKNMFFPKFFSGLVS